MKKALSIFSLLLVSNILNAQWTNTSPDISNTNTGNVFIGATPTSGSLNKLDIMTSGVTNVQIETTSGTGNPNLIFKGSLGQWKVSKSISAGGPSIPSSLDVTYNNGVYGGDRGIMSFYYNGAGGNCVVIGSNNTSILGSCTLGVTGKIGATELVISNLTPFPDFVFTPGYKILSLKEIESFIKQFSRLPEMPSAEKVKKDGLEIGGITNTLVQKVEELTLLMIEMDKKIEKLEMENKSLRLKK